MKIPQRTILTPYCLYEKIKAKYPKRKVEPCAELGNDYFFYIGLGGHTYVVYEDGSVYAHLWENFPKITKIWPRTNKLGQ